MKESQVKERPILFSAPMVHAILEGRKGQTRRVVNPQPKVELFPFKGADNKPNGEFAFVDHPRVVSRHLRCPYGVPCDRLWVRETFAIFSVGGYVRGDVCFPSRAEVGVGYRADHKTGNLADGDGGYNFRTIEGDEAIAQAQLIAEAHYYDWRPSIFMPRWASRITLEITDVRVQRAQDISASDVMAEGVDPQSAAYFKYHGHPDNPEAWVAAYGELWNSINRKKYPWSANPWVWAITFRRIA